MYSNVNDVVISEFILSRKTRRDNVVFIYYAFAAESCSIIEPDGFFKTLTFFIFHTLRRRDKRCDDEKGKIK